MPRIIAGEFRGRRLAAPAENTRPTSDRVREAVFSMLGARTDLAGRRVLDLYAGTGALGLEAVSQGADSAILVESGRKAAAALRVNIATCGAADRVRIAARSVTSYLAVANGPHDLVFIDPPYDLPAADVEDVLEALVPALSDDAWVVLERSSRSAPVRWPAGLRPVVEKTYGDTRVAVAAR